MVHATLGSMNEGQSASPVQGNPDDKPSRSSADVPEASRSEADAGPDPIAEQSNPAPSGLDTGGSPQTGAYASLLSKMPALPIEVVRALEEFRTSIDERVVGAINEFLAEFGTRMDAHDAKADARMDAHEAKSEARIEAHEAKSKARADALEAKVDSLRREVRLIFAMITLVISLLGVRVYQGFTDRGSVQNASTTSATQQAETPVANAEEQTTATSIPALGTSSASEDGAAPNDDAARTDGSSLPTDP